MQPVNHTDATITRHAVQLLLQTHSLLRPFFNAWKGCCRTALPLAISAGRAAAPPCRTLRTVKARIGDRSRPPSGGKSPERMNAQARKGSAQGGRGGCSPTPLRAAFL